VKPPQRCHRRQDVHTKARRHEGTKVTIELHAAPRSVTPTSPATPAPAEAQASARCSRRSRMRAGSGEGSSQPPPPCGDALQDEALPAHASAKRVPFDGRHERRSANSVLYGNCHRNPPSALPGTVPARCRAAPRPAPFFKVHTSPHGTPRISPLRKADRRPFERRAVGRG